MDRRKLFAPGMHERIVNSLANGDDPMSYAVSADQLRKVIRESQGNRALKRRLLSYLERKLIKGRTLVGCVHLGMAMYDFVIQTEDQDFVVIFDNVRDLDKLPYVIANGVRIN